MIPHIPLYITPRSRASTVAGFERLGGRSGYSYGLGVTFGLRWMMNVIVAVAWFPVTLSGYGMLTLILTVVVAALRSTAGRVIRWILLSVAGSPLMTTDAGVIVIPMSGYWGGGGCA